MLRSLTQEVAWAKGARLELDPVDVDQSRAPVGSSLDPRRESPSTSVLEGLGGPDQFVGRVPVR